MSCKAVEMKIASESTTAKQCDLWLTNRYKYVCTMSFPIWAHGRGNAWWFKATKNGVDIHFGTHCDTCAGYTQETMKNKKGEHLFGIYAVW